MGTNTSRQNLYKAESNENFNPTTMLNNNWQKLDLMFATLDWTNLTTKSAFETAISQLPTPSMTLVKVYPNKVYDSSWFTANKTGLAVITKYSDSLMMTEVVGELTSSTYGIVTARSGYFNNTWYYDNQGTYEQ